jgi:hypothetical protein
MRKKLDDIYKKIEEKKELSKQEREKEREREILEKQDRIKKQLQHWSYLNKLYENISPSAGAGAGDGAGGKRFIDRPINQGASFRLPTPLSDPLTRPGVILSSDNVSGNIGRIIIDFYINSEISTQENYPDKMTLFSIYTNPSTSSPLFILGNASSSYNNEIIRTVPGQFYLSDDPIEVGMHKIEATYNQNTNFYDVILDGETIGITGSTSSIYNIDNKKILIGGDILETNIGAGNYVKEIKIYDENDTQFFNFLNQNGLNAATYSILDKTFIIENTLYEEEVGIEIVDSCTPSVAATASEYQAVLNYWNSNNYTLPTLSVQKRQNEVVNELKNANLWDKLDVLILFSNNGDIDTKLTNFKNPQKLYSYLSNSQISFVGTTSSVSSINKGISGLYIENKLSANFGNINLSGDLATFSTQNGSFGIIGKAIDKVKKYRNISESISLITLNKADFITIENYKYSIYWSENNNKLYYSLKDSLTNISDIAEYSFTKEDITQYNTFILNRDLDNEISSFDLNGTVLATQSYTASVSHDFSNQIFALNGLSSYFTLNGIPVQPENVTNNAGNFIWSCVFLGAPMNESERLTIHNILNNYLDCIGTFESDIV